MEDLGFSDSSFNDRCWHINNNNNNNNLLQSNNSTRKTFRHEELLLDECVSQRKQREIVVGALDSVGGGGGGVGAVTVAGGDDGMLVKGAKQTSPTTTVTTTTATTTTTTAAAAATAVTPTYVCRIEDEGGGEFGVGELRVETVAAKSTGAEENFDKLYQQQQHNGDTTPTCTALNNLAALSTLNCEMDTTSYGLAAAAPLSPTDFAAASAAVGLTGGLGSNRTSMNNSTENLSYASDNYYPDDLILLDDDDDDDNADAEEISLNSDDCVYAYRGEGADFDLAAFDANLGRGGVGGALDVGIGATDDETEFLEMDFEPDPLSEAEFANLSVDGDEHANLLLMQRDYNQLSGRHSANMSLQATPTQRQLYSSPIDDLPPQEAMLQTQAQRLNKNFARISLHLDQIKGGSAEEALGVADTDIVLGKRHTVDAIESKKSDVQTAHSLPNTMYTNFGREHSAPPAVVEVSPSKVTGAKPKRLSTFATGSSAGISATTGGVSTIKTSNSNKSRSSLRSVFGPSVHGASASFDERCVSCNDFRTGTSAPSGATSELDCAPMLAAAAAVVVAASAAVVAGVNARNFDLSMNEETCLDCLEKEFLANTIGKAIDLSACVKCAYKRSSSNMSLYNTRAEQTRCRSGSPSYFLEIRDECIFNASNMPTPAPRSNDWTLPAATNLNWETLGGNISNASGVSGDYQRVATECDNAGGVQLLSPNFVLGAPQTPERLATADISEATLLQALDKLQVSYNSELISMYFAQLHPEQSATASAEPKLFASVKEYVLHASKQHCNHRKLTKLIELATEQLVSVQFKEEPNNGEIELLPIKVSDILAHWAHNKDLSGLRTLDKRFHDANVLGKIANVIRQAQQRSGSSSPGTSNRRPLPEFILIPQYYPRGELTLCRKC